jgi:heptosyltransferase-2/heptosyltransferase-3
VKHVVYSALALGAIAFRRRRRIVPDTSALKEVMVVQLGLLGDVLLITPLLELLRETLPADARITLVVPPGSRSVAEGNPHVDVVMTYDAFWADPTDNHRHALRGRHIVDSWRFVRANRDVQYDLIINCWVMDQPLTPLLLSFLNSKCVLGFDFTYGRRFLDATQPFVRDRHIADNVLDLFRGAVRAEPEDAIRRLHYNVPASARATASGSIGEPYIVIAPFSSERAKEWDVEHWATVLTALGDWYPHATLVVTGLKEARERSEELTRGLSGRVHNTVGELTFPQFAHLLERSAAIVTTDSGAMHLASAFAIPVFVLFSQIYNYRQFVPYHVMNDYSVVPVPCAQCIHGCAEVACMKHDVSKVVEQLRRFCDSVPALGPLVAT